MKTCPICGKPIEDNQLNCPHCGSTLLTLEELRNREPKTIEELLTYCDMHHIPLEKMRFFIGLDVKQPKVFGIYRENDEVIVYKNKSNGTRAIRYQGTNEAEAVKIILDKMYEEQDLRRINNQTPAQKRAEKERKQRAYTALGYITMGAVAGLAAWGIYTSATNLPNYYTYNNQHYVNYNDSWYYYDYDSWEPVDNDFYYSDFYYHYDDYYDGQDYDYSSSYTSFQDSEYYEETTSWSDYDEDDDDWSDWGDSWDYNDTDWDSDW